MTCLNFQLPTLPNIDVNFNPAVIPPVPPLNLSLVCCTYQIPIPFINDVIAALNALISVVFDVGGAVVNGVLLPVNLAIDAINAALLQLRLQIPDCPLNSLVGAIL